MGRSVKRVTRKAIRRRNRRRPVSGLEREVRGWLKEDGIAFVPEYPVGECHADIFLPPNILVELNGCFYHGCSKCNPKPTARQLAAGKRDERRYAFFKSRGFEVVVVKECEVNRRPAKCRRLLRSLSGDEKWQDQ